MKVEFDRTYKTTGRHEVGFDFWCLILAPASNNKILFKIKEESTKLPSTEGKDTNRKI